MKRRQFVGYSIAAGAAMIARPLFAAEKVVRLGMIAEMSGPFAEFGYQFSTAIKAFSTRHGDSFGGKRLEVIYKDVGGPNPEVSRRLAQELVLNNKVDFLGGFGFTPNALTAAAVSAQAHVPMIVMNAQGMGLPEKSPYLVRTSLTSVESAIAIARWAVDNKIMTMASIVMDYAPGLDAEKAFTEAYEKAGGKLLGSPIRVPISTADYSPYLQKVKDLKPAALFAFTSGGNTGVAFLKALRERGIQDAGIKIISTGDITIEPVLAAAGRAALDIVTTYPYSAAHGSPENQRFVADFLAAGDQKTVPSIFAASAYDGMMAIAEVMRKTSGDITPDSTMSILRGLKIDSPRGPLQISATTREPLHNIYVRRVEEKDGRIANYEFQTIKKTT
jgi:branched-chain amino acid transport system substrate-binding protein